MCEDELAHGQAWWQLNFAEERLVLQTQLFYPAVALAQELTAHIVVGHDHLNALLGGFGEFRMR